MKKDMNRGFKRILIANRGETAVRIIRACRELGIESVLVHSTADRDTLAAKLADFKVCIGKPANVESYLNSYRIISTAMLKKADAIHPGIGYFAESSEFAQLCRDCNILFIGPDSEIIKKMGNKIEARKIARASGVPVVEGNDEPVDSAEECVGYVQKIGLPVILKAANGGGGKGIRFVYTMDELPGKFELCRQEAAVSFNSGEMLIERYIERAKHIEVQILADSHGNVIHLGDRECSIQRSNQKLIEETRCPGIKDEVRENLYQDAVKVAKSIGYIGPGTVEFLLLPDDSYYFMEMNTRLQVEHTITENITGIDLVKEQIRIFEGRPLSYRQKDVGFNGYSIECRILAEDVSKNFRASCGKITRWDMPGGPGVRVDAGYRNGDTITPYYDSLVAKITCTDKNKELAIRKMLCCLEEMAIEGIETNVEFLKYILMDRRFLSGDYTTKFIHEIMDNEPLSEPVPV